MPTFNDATTTTAPPEEVWKILYDPSRFPDWWVGFETVAVEKASAAGERRYTMYPDGYPDFPIPQVLRSSRDEGSVVVSCLVSDLRFEWHLEAVDRGTRISVEVEIPEREAHRLDGQREVISASLARLAGAAAACAQPS
jgi:uncharacterized protein YndB with AHSA1/START domain